MWRGLLTTNETIKRSTCNLIGNGVNTKAWLDPWIPENPEFKPIPTQNAVIGTALRVKDLLLPHTAVWWDNALLSTLFDTATIANVLQNLSLFSYGRWGGMDSPPRAGISQSNPSINHRDQRWRFHKGKQAFLKVIQSQKLRERLQMHKWGVATNSLPWSCTVENICHL